MRRQSMEQEKIFENDATHKGLISTTHKQLTQQHKNTQLSRKTGWRLK